MHTLLVISSAPASLVDGKLFLDVKFVEGMRFYADLWDGPVSCILKLRAGPFPFGKVYDVSALPFEIKLLPATKYIGADDVGAADIVLAGGDNHEYLHLGPVCETANAKLVYIIENIPETRRQIIFLARDRSFPKKVYSLLWTMRQEAKRRKAFRQADGIQANGYPAFLQYNPLNRNTIMYLDNRLSEEIFATQNEMEERLARLKSDAPVRLVHSGRLEALKGSQDLIPIAWHLDSKNVDFTLDIFGTGSLEGEIREGILKHSLQKKVRLRGVVDFESELVPFVRAHADIYLSCHRQSDPSCTYIENMGCGVAVVGYDNRMWSALCQESGGGWVVPLGKPEKAADAIAEAIFNRPLLAERCKAAQLFAQRHSFENEFRRRIAHLNSSMQSLVIGQDYE